MGRDLNLERESLSKRWFDDNARKKDGFAKLKRNMGSFFRKKKAKASDIMWTCPESHSKNLKGNGYTRVRRLTAEEKRLPEQERLRVERKCSCFVSCNARATNAFSDRSVLVYAINMFYNPMIKGFFLEHGVPFDEEQYALSCMIQWVWRSRIRNGQPISIYIPAKRMRELFLAWLNPAEPDDADCSIVPPIEVVLPRPP